MYRITTRTGRTVHIEIATLNEAIFKMRVLELNAKRANIYSPGYYRIEKYDEKAVQSQRKNPNANFVTRCHKVSTEQK